MGFSSPVRPLCDQCLGVFETANPSSTPMLRRAVAEGHVNPQIDLNCVAGVPRAPYVAGTPATISLHITHLEMLWAFTYGLFVSFEHEMREAMLHKGMDVAVPAYSEVIRRRAANLLGWSKRLHVGYSAWPIDTPSPISHLPEESELVGKVNTLFLKAVALMLHHEFCHAAHGHMAKGLTPEEILEQEKEADDFAYHQFISNFSSEREKRILAWSMLLPPLLALYLIKRPEALFQVKHPHVHHRIAHTLGKLNFLNEENQDYFDGLCLSAITTYMVENHLLDDEFHHQPDLRAGFDRASDALEYFLGRLDSLIEPI